MEEILISKPKSLTKKTSKKICRKEKHRFWRSQKMRKEKRMKSPFRKLFFLQMTKTQGQKRFVKGFQLPFQNFMESQECMRT